MKSLILLLICILIFQGRPSAQEEVVGLYSNPKIKHELKMMEASGQIASRTEQLFPRPIHLPVFDDFHTDHIFPDTAWFSDMDAFINDDFPYRSVNIGAATMDAIDAYGNIYPDASMFPFVADHLTSRPVRLDSLFLPGETRAITLADSIYFSFFYQPQGRGNPPESFDSLVLQFGHYAGDSVFAYMDSITVAVSAYLSNPNDTIFPFDTLYAPSQCNPGVYMINYDTLVWDEMVTVPCDSVFEASVQWEHVWSTEGMRIDTFYTRYNTYSRQVMIPVTDSLKYYNKYFYFRFFNYASLASDNNPSWKSNCDQWNIDYIYLNIDRTAADTVYRAITFAERAPSFLSDFTAMPLRQYRNDPTNQLKDSLKLFITNLSADTFNVFYKYLIDEQGGSYSHIYNGGFANLYPFYLTGYQSCASVPQHACPPRDFLFPLSSLADSSSYNVRHVIHDQSNPDLGDTIHFIQKFYNYYAYDDGTPELGYGLSLAGGKAAFRFTLNIADTLKGVAMFFNRVQDNVNDQFFTLKVWDNNNGKPGNVIWQQESLKPKFSDELYRMQIYQINLSLPLIGTFFIGFEQTTADLLNIGFDTHHDASEHTFYNTSGNWEQSMMAGSMLMRPILSTFYDPFLEEENLPDYTWNIYPNPVSGKLLHIQNSMVSEADLSSSHTTISIYDMPGRKLLSMPYNNTLSIDKLPRGMYLLHIMNEDHSINYIHKLLVNN
ncbi:MAG: T9SS type A sorting domain-containing protein [Bacteroidetes bacterium]|nr:T9SS type A sorting domain-containing protein [Bacteroidota bacterium]